MEIYNTDDMKRIDLKLPTDLYHDVKTLAKKKGFTVSTMIRLLLMQGLFEISIQPK